MSERVSLFRRIINRYRENVRRIEAEKRDPLKRFQRAAGGLRAAGVIALGVVLFVIGGSVLAVLFGTEDTCDWNALLGLSVMIPPSGFCVWAGLALKRRRPWARKAAAVLCGAAIAIIVGSFSYLWITIARLFWSTLQDQLRAGAGVAAHPYLMFYLALILATIVQGGACIFFGWACFRAAEYFMSDDVKRLCGELPEVPRGEDP